jgi:hypothetical protein
MATSILEHVGKCQYIINQQYTTFLSAKEKGTHFHAFLYFYASTASTPRYKYFSKQVKKCPQATSVLSLCLDHLLSLTKHLLSYFILLISLLIMAFASIIRTTRSLNVKL